MKFNFANKNVLVLAANGGLGNCIANSYRKLGANLCLVSRNSNALVLLRKSLIKIESRRKIHLINCNLENIDSTQYIFNELKKFNFKPDIVIHNLGSTLKIRSFQSKKEDIFKVLWVNALFAVELNQLILPLLLKRKWARIIHISSISSKSLRGSGPYAASKSYLDSYSICLARELAKTNVVVSSIQPGAFIANGNDWDNNLNQRPNMVNDFLRHHHASGRLGRPDDFISTILLMSSESFRWGHGAVINIDGGTM